jgi:hypothetical protein
MAVMASEIERLPDLAGFLESPPILIGCVSQSGIRINLCVFSLELAAFFPSSTCVG